MNLKACRVGKASKVRPSSGQVPQLPHTSCPALLKLPCWRHCSGGGCACSINPGAEEEFK